MGKILLGTTELSSSSNISDLETTVSNLSDQVETITEELEGLETLLSSI